MNVSRPTFSGIKWYVKYWELSVSPNVWDIIGGCEDLTRLLLIMIQYFLVNTEFTVIICLSFSHTGRINSSGLKGIWGVYLLLCFKSILAVFCQKSISCRSGEEKCSSFHKFPQVSNVTDLLHTITSRVWPCKQSSNHQYDSLIISDVYYSYY